MRRWLGLWGWGKCLGCLGAGAADSEEAWRSSIGNIAKFTPKNTKYNIYIHIMSISIYHINFPYAWI
jgi:hypothetical protein